MSDDKREPWRVGTHYGIHLYRGNVPLGTMLCEEDAALVVRCVNACWAEIESDAFATVQAQKDQIAELEGQLEKAREWVISGVRLTDRITELEREQREVRKILTVPHDIATTEACHRVMRDVRVRRDMMAEQENVAKEAFDAIAKACGCDKWDYPGQLVRDVEAQAARVRKLEGDLKAAIDARDRAAADERTRLLAIMAQERARCRSELPTIWWEFVKDITNRIVKRMETVDGEFPEACDSPFSPKVAAAAIAEGEVVALKPDGTAVPMKQVCSVCNDTHLDMTGPQVQQCTHCPIPCVRCRTRGRPYCAVTPCPCSCHTGEP